MRRVILGMTLALLSFTGHAEVTPVNTQVGYIQVITVRHTGHHDISFYFDPLPGRDGRDEVPHPVGTNCTLYDRGVIIERNNGVDEQDNNMSTAGASSMLKAAILARRYDLPVEVRLGQCVPVHPDETNETAPKILKVAVKLYPHYDIGATSLPALPANAHRVEIVTTRHTGNHNVAFDADGITHNYGVDLVPAFPGATCNDYARGVIVERTNGLDDGDGNGGYGPVSTVGASAMIEVAIMSIVGRLPVQLEVGGRCAKIHPDELGVAHINAPKILKLKALTE